MDYTTLLTADVFLNLQCDSCKKYLSHFPICISGDKKDICGRCCKTLKEDYAKNTVYEILAQFMKFPCCYKEQGCGDFFLPKDIPSHEKICEFQKIQCITKKFSDCNWEGSRPLLLHHCYEKHGEIMLKNRSFELDLSKSYQRENLIEYKTNVFIVKQKFYSINKLMEFCIYNSKEAQYELCFNTKNRKVVLQSCTTSPKKEQVTEIFLDCLKEQGNSSLIVTARITFEDLKEETSTVEEKLDEELLAQLQCRYCKKYALPPIYVHETVSLLGENPICCSYCKETNVSSFKEKVNRTFHLERIANILNYPCRFAENGCNFIAKPSQMKQHIEFCPEGTHRCPLYEYVQCQWVGLGKNINAHILDSHGHLVLNSSTVSERLVISDLFKTPSTFNPEAFINSVMTPKSTSTCSVGTNTPIQKTVPRFGERKTTSSPSADPTFSKCYVIKFSDRLFRLNFAKMSHYYQWAVQIIGPLQEKFMFQVEIIDRSNQNCSLIAKKPCTSLTKKDDVFTVKNCYFHKEQVTPFLSDDTITFKVHVYQ